MSVSVSLVLIASIFALVLVLPAVVLSLFLRRLASSIREQEEASSLSRRVRIVELTSVEPFPF